MRAILHIGCEKTGTTSIQNFLSRNRRLLTHQGALYPEVTGGFNHADIVAFAQDDDRFDDLRRFRHINSPEMLKAFREKIRKRMKMIHSESITGVHTHIFSSEHMSSRLQRSSEVRRLARLMYGYYDSVRIILYLRRQDRLATSLYSTYLRTGGTEEEIFRGVGKGVRFYDYDRMLSIWSKYFEDIDVRIFSREELRGGNIINDFLDVTSLKKTSDLVETQSKNERIAAPEQEFLRVINKYVPRYVDGVPNIERGAIAERLGSSLGGKGLLPTKSEAREFLEPYVAGNENVRQSYLPERKALFDNSFDEYPDNRQTKEFDFEDAVLVASRIWKNSRDEEMKLRSENLMLRSKLAVAEGNMENAAALALEAVELRADSVTLRNNFRETISAISAARSKVAYLRRATSICPEAHGFHFDLAKALGRMGDFQGAASHAAEAVRLVPKTARYQRELTKWRSRLVL